MHVIGTEWLSWLVIILCNLCDSFSLPLSPWAVKKKKGKEKSHTYTQLHCKVELFALNSSLRSSGKSWRPSPSPPGSPAGLGIKTSTSSDKTHENEGGGVKKSNRACPGLRAAAVGHPDKSSSLMLSFAMAATLMKNGTCQPCHDHIRICSPLVSTLRLSVMITSFSSRLFCVGVFWTYFLGTQRMSGS